MHLNRRGLLAGASSSATVALLNASKASVAFAEPAFPNSGGTDLPRFKAPADACDSHIHVFNPARFAMLPGTQYPDRAAIADYRLMQRRLGMSRTVIVTPRPYGTDNRVTMDAVSQLGIDNARGVVVVPPDVGTRELRAMADAGACGIRFTVHNPQTSVVQIDMIEPLAKRIADLGLHLQLHLRADQIVQASDMLKRLPATLVFDHMARLPQPAGLRHAGYKVVMDLIEQGRTWIKVSGPYQDSKAGPPDYDDVADVARAFIKAAPERVVWGSDWPHTTEKDKPDGANLIDLLAKWCGDDLSVRRILVDNPRSLYQFR